MNNDINLRNLAHLGDSVYELFIREHTIQLTSNIKKLHELTISYVNAEFQTKILAELEPLLSEEESDIIRRARNLPTTTARRVNHKLHRLATAFEALLGYLYLNDKSRLQEILNIIKTYL